MADFIKQLSEMLNRIGSAQEKLVLLEKLLKEAKDPEIRDAIKKFMAQVEKELDDKKKEAAAKAKKLSEFERMIAGDFERKPLPPPVEETRIEPIERQLEFAEDEIKKPTIEKGLGYLEKPADEQAYNPNVAKIAEKAYKSEIHSMDDFESIEERGFKTETYQKREISSEKNLEGYSPKDEILAESMKEYKRKKRL
ncbi:MAG: hypothetical protein PHC66_04990 [Candidatus Nanoarchaeia archaeon]|nr:hypothetical protein [Candidatus Nanoarchaeia archaeon]MDD5239751.1 hypothetical protein [Candidatus Nanoarchaeia archaeon]